MKYVSVIVDNNSNATDELYTYISEFNDIQTGNKVSLPFSRSNRIVDGYIAAVSDEKPEGIVGMKKIRTIDPDFRLSKEAVETALWMHGRYVCRYIEAVRCFLPGRSSSRATKDPFEGIERRADKAKALNDEQQRAYASLADSLEKKRADIFLLFGVTGSGKTEVYLQAMQKCLEQGRQGVMLVPEISLTPQTVSRFIDRFGKENIAVIHSRLTPQQRAAEYRRIAEGGARIVIGARSAVFAPFDDIGLIILDEEHDASYKSDMSPKYDCRELAAKRVIAHSAVLLLGSATPSVSDYYRCRQGIFKELRLKERYNKVPLPEVSVVDMRAEIKAGNRSLFSSKLVSEIKSCSASGKQMILLLNRRGYSNFVSCRDCGYTVKCPDCGIAMSYHKEADALICHYCGKRKRLPKRCPDCGSSLIGRFGAGTEQLEEKAKELFPELSIERLDLDTAKRKGSAESALRRFAKGKTDMLIGTQLVAKGLDFANVGLVGVINADTALNLPDFRAAERSFQLVTQAAGRAGRGDERGRVVIQTYTPDHPAVVCAAKQDYLSFYEQEIKIRKLAAYPPFTSIFRLVFGGEDEKLARQSAEKCAEVLSEKLDDSYLLLGPCMAPINKAGKLYRYQLMIKAPAEKRRALSSLINSIKKDRKETTLLTVDIDPYSLL